MIRSDPEQGTHLEVQDVQQLDSDVAVVQTDLLQAKLVRWNLAALILDVSCFSIGMAFMDQNAVLPLLLKRLGASGMLIGAFAAARFLAFTLFQLFVAYATHGRIRQKPFLVLIVTLTRAPLLVMPWFLWNAGRSDASRSLALTMTILLLTVWALGDGLGYVPWMEIVARAFSDKTRGRFFASTQLLSGVAGIVIAAFIVTGILQSRSLLFPHNYALLSAIFALMLMISLIGVLLLKEPPAPPLHPDKTHLPPLGEYFRRLPGMVRSNPTFGRLAVIQLLIGFGAAASPFYVLYASSRFHLGDLWGGRFQVYQAIGIVLLMPLWTFLNERYGPGASVRGVAFACCLTPLIALTLGSLSPWLFGLVFLLMGGSLNWGLWITLNHYLLTHIAEDERAIYIALLNLLFVPSALYPFLGGLMIRQETLITLGSVPLLFLITILVTGAGSVLALKLPEPDEGREEERGKREEKAN